MLQINNFIISSSESEGGGGRIIWGKWRGSKRDADHKNFNLVYSTTLVKNLLHCKGSHKLAK